MSQNLKYQRQIHINGAAGEKPFFLNSKKNSFKKDYQINFFSQMLHRKNTFQHPLDDFNGNKLSLGNRTKAYKNRTTKNKLTKKLPICESINTINYLESNEKLKHIEGKQ